MMLETNRRSRERGAALVEFSFMATILVSLVLGVFEIGSAWSDHQSLTSASRAGARVASQIGVDGSADSETLYSIEAAMGGLGSTISRIVVYEADINGEMPAGCATATVGYSGGLNCNVYDANSISNLSTPGWWGTGGSSGSADGNWCAPSERDDAQMTATYVGVLIEIDRPYLTGFFGGGTQSMSEATVMRIEPDL